MSVCVWVFSSEDWANFEDSLHITTKHHLLVELWGLSQACFLIEILQSEYIGTTFWGTSDELGGVDFDEVLGVEELSEEHADCGLESHESLVGWHSQIDNSIVQSHILIHNCVFVAFFLFFSLSTFLFIFLILYSSASIFKLEWENRNWLVDNPDFADLQFNIVLGAGVDGVLWDAHGCLHVNNWFLGNLRCEFDHTLWDLLWDSENCLHSGELFSHYKEAHLASGTRCVQSSPHQYFLTVMLFTEVFHSGVDLGVSLLGVWLWSVKLMLAK